MVDLQHPKQSVFLMELKYRQIYFGQLTKKILTSHKLEGNTGLQLIVPMKKEQKSLLQFSQTILIHFILLVLTLMVLGSEHN